MLKVTITRDALYFGDGFSLSFQRTLRIPDDGKTYPLPPGLGAFPICQVGDYPKRVPGSWLEQGGVFIPMYQREALWIFFQPRYWKPNAVKVAVGRVNAVSGEPWDEVLRPGEEDYLVCPPQPWLDGINAGEGYIRQFVAMPLGLGYTVEAQVTGEERFGGIQIVVYESKPGRFPDEPPPRKELFREAVAFMDAGLELPVPGGMEMGIGAGGMMKQKIYPDPHGIGTWDQDNYGQVYVHIVNSIMYREITGQEPPPTPISAATYTQYGLPWFDLYDDKMADVAAPDALKQVKSVKQMDEGKGLQPEQDDRPVEIPDKTIVTYPMGPEKEDIGD